jgi:TonB family protein
MRGIAMLVVEVSMPHFRPAAGRMRFSALAISVLLISGFFPYLHGVSGQQGRLIPPQSPGTDPIGYKILSPTEGVDFLPYLTTLDAPLGRNFFAKRPKAIAGAGKGVVVVRVQIQKDGGLPDGSVTMVSSSGNDDVDAAALNAIRGAAPFGRLPEKYSGAILDLQVRFYFKNKPPEKAPKIVPLKTPETV